MSPSPSSSDTDDEYLASSLASSSDEEFGQDSTNSVTSKKRAPRRKEKVPPKPKKKVSACCTTRDDAKGDADVKGVVFVVVEKQEQEKCVSICSKGEGLSGRVVNVCMKLHRIKGLNPIQGSNLGLVFHAVTYLTTFHRETIEHII